MANNLEQGLNSFKTLTLTGQKLFSEIYICYTSNYPIIVTKSTFHKSKSCWKTTFNSFYKAAMGEAFKVNVAHAGLHVKTKQNKNKK